MQIGDEAAAHSDACGPDAKAAFDRARRAWEQFEAMDEDRPGGYAYCEATGRHEHVDADGQYALHKASLGMDMVRYQYDDVEPIVQSLFFFQSAPYVLTSYDTVVCLGAVPQQPADAERRFVVQVKIGAYGNPRGVPPANPLTAVPWHRIASYRRTSFARGRSKSRWSARRCRRRAPPRACTPSTCARPPRRSRARPWT